MQAASYDPGLIENTFFTIYITHLATKQTIDFRGWVTEFSDQFTSTWNTETVYGRMDPLATFQNTQRQISLGFDVVSGDAEQAVQNLARINKLISFLYPVYENSGRNIQNTLKAGPLLGMRWTNLISDSTDGSQLIGFLGGASYSPDMNQGGFISGQGYKEVTDGEMPAELDTGSSTKTKMVDFIKTEKGTKGLYVPKVVSLTLDFTVLHKHLTGWSEKSGKYSFGKDGAVFPNAAPAIIPGTRTDQTTIYEKDEITGDPGDPIKQSDQGAVLEGTGGK